MSVETYLAPAVDLLRELIAIPSFSREEGNTAGLLQQYLEDQGKQVYRKHHNIWTYSHDFRADWPTVLLNSHHDTVKPAVSWTLNPFEPLLQDGKLYGLGSNDAGGALVCLLHTFLYLDEVPDRGFNILFAATAEEEISGEQGIISVAKEWKITVGIIGEPTQMRMAVAEKGLMVLDGTAQGVSGHAARQEGVNAIYAALQDIQWLQNFRFPKRSDVLGEVNVAVTQIQAGTQHNVVPDRCTFVVDVRTNELYTNEEALNIIRQHVISQVRPRSLRLNSSAIALDHPLVEKGIAMGLEYYGSPTLSDQALLTGFPTLKMGPGKSERSHTADEFIFVDEIRQGMQGYSKLLENLHL